MPPSFFGRRAPLEVEIGSGKARFLIASAQASPDRRLSRDRAVARLTTASAASVSRARGLANARIVRADGRLFVESALAPASVAAFHIYFPDPWPKKKQKKRRLLDGIFLELLAARLEPGGTLRIATDHPDYGRLARPSARNGSGPRADRPGRACPPRPHALRAQVLPRRAGRSGGSPRARVGPRAHDWFAGRGTEATSPLISHASAKRTARGPSYGSGEGGGRPGRSGGRSAGNTRRPRRAPRRRRARGRSVRASRTARGAAPGSGARPPRSA